MSRKITDSPASNEVERAEQSVQSHLSRFENAMDHLEVKVSESSQKIQRAREVARHPRLLVDDGLARVRSALIPLVGRGLESGRRFQAEFQRDPRPYVISALGIIGAFLAYRSFAPRHRHSHHRLERRVVQALRSEGVLS